MSQLDITIFFYNMTGLIICFFITIHLVSFILSKFWYNKKLRNININQDLTSKDSDNLIYIKRILKT
uniref:ATP synthase F0 subunit 8 n=1 Tax=Rhizophysa eysenhardtii TaxID=2721092 RepID=UPI0026E2696D|nr:ATP synthase F0 subunit 8 [Rhizophysa eysenhardtii]WJJ69937.1 ATP synthase F0 subunit 8 [Rhizophysa eysenhardtii]